MISTLEGLNRFQELAKAESRAVRRNWAVGNAQAEAELKAEEGLNGRKARAAAIDVQVAALCGQGLTQIKVAEMLDVSKAQVWHSLHRQGLKL